MLTMLTLAAAIFAAFTVGPAAAGTDSHGTWSGWCDESSVFADDLRSLATDGR